MRREKNEMSSSREIQFWKVYGNSKESNEAAEFIRSAEVPCMFDGYTEFSRPTVTFGGRIFSGIDQIREVVRIYKEWKKEGKI